MAWLSEEVTFFSTNIFFTCALERILSTSLRAKRGSSTGRYFPGEDGSRAGNGDRVMGMPPVQPSSSHSSQVGSLKTSSTQGSIVLASHGQYEMPFINKSEATKRSKDRQIYGKCTNGTNRRSRVWPVCFIYIKLLILIFLKRFQKLILISLHVIYIILSSWIEIRPLSLTSNPPTNV